MEEQEVFTQEECQSSSYLAHEIAQILHPLFLSGSILTDEQRAKFGQDREKWDRAEENMAHEWYQRIGMILTGEVRRVEVAGKWLVYLFCDISETSDRDKHLLLVQEALERIKALSRACFFLFNRKEIPQDWPIPSFRINRQWQELYLRIAAEQTVTVYKRNLTDDLMHPQMWCPATQEKNEDEVCNQLMRYGHEWGSEKSIIEHLEYAFPLLIRLYTEVPGAGFTGLSNLDWERFKLHATQLQSYLEEFLQNCSPGLTNRLMSGESMDAILRSTIRDRVDIVKFSQETAATILQADAQIKYHMPRNKDYATVHKYLELLFRETFRGCNFKVTKEFSEDALRWWLVDYCIRNRGTGKLKPDDQEATNDSEPVVGRLTDNNLSLVPKAAKPDWTSWLRGVPDMKP